MVYVSYATVQSYTQSNMPTQKEPERTHIISDIPRIFFRDFRLYR